MEIGIKEVNIKQDEEIKIFFMGDVHFGSASTDHKALKWGVHKIIETSLKYKTYVCLMGDIIDAIIPGDPRFDPSEIDERYSIRDLKNLPLKQFEDFCEVVKPVADLIVSANVGNHEEQYIKRHANDVYGKYKEVFPNVELLGAAGFMVFKLIISGNVRKNLHIGLIHGSGGGGGMREGYPINKCFDTFRWWEGDFMIMGHMHQMATHPGNKIWVSNTDKLKAGPCWHGVNGCFMLKHKVGCRNYFEPKPGPLPGIGMLEATIKINQLGGDGNREWKCKTRLEKVWLR